MARCSWKLGKIQHLRTGLDGEVQSADILPPNHMIIAGTINFFCIFLNITRKKFHPNITDVEPNLTDGHILLINDKRKAYLVAQREYLAV